MEKIKILYIDDELFNLEAFTIAFMFDKKFEIYTAESGTKGLEIIQKNNEIKVVVSDLLMPEMDGLEFIKKARFYKPKIACIILSGYTETFEIKEALKEGIIDDYIMKPYIKEELEESLIRALNKTNNKN